MRRQLRSEFLKLTTTRTLYCLGAGVVGVVCLSTWSTVSSAGAASVTGALRTQSFFLLASVHLALFAVVLGVRASTDEFRYGTIVSSVVSSAGRGQLIGAKAAVAGVGGAVLAVVAQTAMVGLALALAASAGGSLQISESDVAAMAGLTGASALWASIGVGVGALVRHQVAAVVGVVVWILAVENLGAGLLGAGGRYLPGQAAHGMAQLPGFVDAPLAAALLTGYTAVFLVAAHAATTGRDL